MALIGRLLAQLARVAPGIFQWGADSYKDGARMQLQGYYKKKNLKNSYFTF